MTVVVRVPASAETTAPRELTLDEVPGATLAFHGEWWVPHGRLLVACATRPAPLWVSQLGPIVLDGMTGMVRRHLGAEGIHTDAAAPTATTLTQNFNADGMMGRHAVGFVDTHTLLACTTVCEASPRSSCATLLDDVELEAGFVVREPEVTERIVGAVLQHPRAALAVVLLLLLAVAVRLLVRRPSEADVSGAQQKTRADGQHSRSHARVRSPSRDD